MVLCQADLPVLYEVNQPNQNVVVFRGADLSLAQSQGLLGQGRALPALPPPPAATYKPSPSPSLPAAAYTYALPYPPAPLVPIPAPAPAYSQRASAYVEDQYTNVRVCLIRKNIKLMISFYKRKYFCQTENFLHFYVSG